MAVDEDYRDRGIGSKLVKKIQQYAREHNLKVQLVSIEGTIEFYKKLGFEIKRELPSFLPYTPGYLMEFSP